MIRRYRAIVIVLTALLIWGSTCWSAERRRFAERIASRPVPADTFYAGPVTGIGTHAHVRPWVYYRGRYPRYVGALHAREIQNLGVPTGDIGPRGNGIFWSPW